MTKVFLSHSSAQKGFVREIAKKLSKQDIVYDEYTFEEGEKTISEIFIGIEQTCLFVLFISDESLNSSWVKSEIKEAKEKLDSNSLLRIYPVIIDKNINYDDPRIPDWLKEEYNLKYVSKPTKISNRISSQLKMLNWNQYPKNQKRSNIFVGRTSQIPSYEERIFNFDKPKPIVFIATGLPSIGRRKFTNHCLTKTNIVTIEYSPVTLVTNYRDSIENFIIGLYDLGFSDVSRSELTNFLKMEMNKKVELATTLLLEIEEHEKLLSIVDNFSIVKEDGFLVEWFTQIINKIEHINRLFISLISRRRVKFKEISRNNRIFAIAIPELKVNEKKNTISNIS
ncbi:hypothetical protein JCM19298_488 [Nonlabens ulvanivorans]|nr:toll/interleukin-1 receptor domain-containing protein [Nonlabens ulvanivorans]GAK94013.1 hypothetical protein JCM19298_488 [Nonlabens ulvanivorans]